MGWFDEQIKQRVQNDEAGFAEAIANMSSIVMGRAAFAEAFSSDQKRTKDAIDEILHFYHVKPQELAQEFTDMQEQLEVLLRPSGIMRRTVALKDEWYKDGIGALLGSTKNGKIVAILPSGFSGYSFLDEQTGKKVKVTKKTAALLSGEAICFYKPLPLKKLGVRDLLQYMLETLSIADFALIGLLTLAVVLVGLWLPQVSNIIYSQVVPSGNAGLILPVAGLMLGVVVASQLIGIAKNMVMGRVQIKMDVAVQAATMMRVLSLPADFFKGYSAGELSSRTQQVGNLCNMLLSALLSTGLTSVFSLVYIAQILSYAPGLVVPAMAIILITVGFSVATMLVQMKVSEKTMQYSAKQNGLVFALISGVQKLKLSGAERRAFSKWADGYQKIAKLEYNPPLFLELNAAISTAINLFGVILMYERAIASGISVADYMSFHIAYGMVSGAFMSLASMALIIANIKPVLEMVKPILKTVPEVSAGKKVITNLSGAIELNNVSFRYADNTPLIIDNLSLKIRPGQYVAIVGSTGCGKSTLMRLMLGFETPQKGAIYYDGKDLTSIDLKSLRRKVGVVMQSGKLFYGDVYANITISAPWLSLDEAWAAAEMAGIGEDIRSMPMGMHTMISEGSGGVSGGQRQRLMIARAIAPKPKVLMFDEATSALDNKTQKTVSTSLDSLKSTRIVIAHRLSTIKQCDRIIVLDKGRIAEDGRFDELIQKGGFFAELVARQRLDDTGFVGRTTLF